MYDSNMSHAVPCFVVPRLLFDGWSYQDYMSVLDSEDEIEDIGREIVEVAKVHVCYVCYSWLNTRDVQKVSMLYLFQNK